MTEPIEILYVEDDPRDRELTLRVLRKGRLTGRIEVACDGEEALALIFGNSPGESEPLRYRPRLILLDLKLPKVSGMDVLRRLKSDERTRTIPVVMLTSSREERDLIESYGLGVNSYVVKPVEFEKLNEVARSLRSYWVRLNEPPLPDGD